MSHDFISMKEKFERLLNLFALGDTRVRTTVAGPTTVTFAATVPIGYSNSHLARLVKS